MHGAIVAARPGLAHTNPAARLFVKLPVAVPVELHFDAAVLVGPDLFTSGPGDDCGLRPGGVGLGRYALAAIGRGFGDDIKADAVRGGVISSLAATAAGAVTAADVLFEAVVGRLDEVFLVLIASGVFAEGEQIAWCNVSGIAFAMRCFPWGVLLLDGDARVVFAIVHIGIAARPFEDFSVVFWVPCWLCFFGIQQGLGLFKIVVVGGKVA